jgi:hypothetical protein
VVVAPVRSRAVDWAALAWLLLLPGTTVWPVAPGVVLFVAGLPWELVVVFRAPLSPVFMVEAPALSAVPVVAVVERLLPRLPAGLFCCATAIESGAAINVAASKAERNFKSMAVSFQRSHQKSDGGD